MRPHGLLVAIDGPVGAGKSSLARALARRIGYAHVESGSMYRAVAWAALREGVDLTDGEAVSRLAGTIRLDFRITEGECRILVDGEDVTAALRLPAVEAAASAVSVFAGVRERLVEIQRRIGAEGGVVMDGRDIGTVVFPDADLKIYLDATPEERARRRHQELLAYNHTVSRAEVLREVEERDARDKGRSLSPLRPAPDAVYLDTTAFSHEEVLERLLTLVKGCR